MKTVIKTSKIYLFLILYIVVCSQSASAQRHYSGISGIEGTAGVNLFGDSRVYSSFSVSKYRSRTTYWKIGLNYLEKSFKEIPLQSESVDDSRLNMTARDFYLDAAYFKTVSTNLSSLYFSLGIGAFSGVEYYKENQEYEYDFLLGPKVEAELELFVSSRVALLGRVTQDWSPFSDIRKWNTILSFGFKVLIY